MKPDRVRPIRASAAVENATVIQPGGSAEVLNKLAQEVLSNDSGVSDKKLGIRNAKRLVNPIRDVARQLSFGVTSLDRRSIQRRGGTRPGNSVNRRNPAGGTDSDSASGAR
jgi:hypothetical protein